MKTIEEFKQELEAKVFFFGECRFSVSTTEDGDYKLEVSDYEIYNLYDAYGKLVEEDVESECVRWTFYTNKEGIIGFIEHGYISFTKANREDVLFIAGLIGLQLNPTELEELSSVD